MRKYIRLVLKNIKNIKTKICFDILLRIVKAATNIIIPLVYAQIITSLLDKNINSVVYNLIFLAFCYALSLLVGHFVKVVENKMSKIINYQTKQQVTSMLYTIPPYKLNYSQGKMHSILLSDSSTISSLLFTFMSTLFSIITLLGVGIVVFTTSWKLALIMLCTYPLTYLVNMVFNKKIKKRPVDLIEQSDRYICTVKNSIGNITDVKMQGGALNIKDRLENK